MKNPTLAWMSLCGLCLIAGLGGGRAEGEVRATSFVLVDEEGAECARLGRDEEGRIVLRLGRNEDTAFVELSTHEEGLDGPEARMVVRTENGKSLTRGELSTSLLSADLTVQGERGEGDEFGPETEVAAHLTAGLYPEPPAPLAVLQLEGGKLDDFSVFSAHAGPSETGAELSHNDKLGLRLFQNDEVGGIVEKP